MWWSTSLLCCFTGSTGAHGSDYAVYCGGSAVLVWLVFFGPCTQVHGQGFPRHQGGERGGGDAGSLLPGVLPFELVACVGAYRQRHVSYITSAPPPPPPPRAQPGCTHSGDLSVPLAVDMSLHVHGACGAAMRRRQRRLRAQWRHEQQTVAMVLATVGHHSFGPTANDALRSQKPVTSTREGVEGETYDAPRRQKPPPPGSLPAPLSEVAGRQEVLVRHVVEHMADVCPVVQILDAPVPQMVDTVLEFFRALDPPVDEQVIAVPKISIDSVSRRLVERRLPQMVEQLVEVPTIVSFSSLQRILEQTVDIPASRGRGRRGGLQDFFPGQSSTAAADVDFPVPRGDLQGFLPCQGSTASSSLSGAVDDAGQGVFRTFPHGKKVRSAGQVSADLPPARQLMDPGGLSAA